MTPFWSPILANEISSAPPLRRCNGSAPAPTLAPSPVVAVPSATPRDPADGLRQQERSRRQPRQQEDPACSHDSKRIPPAAKGSFLLSSARRRPMTFTQVSPATHDACLRWKLPPSPSCCPPRRWRLKFAHSESEVWHLFNYFLLIFIRAVEHLFAPNNNNDRFLALKEHVMGMNFWHWLVVSWIGFI